LNVTFYLINYKKELQRLLVDMGLCGQLFYR